jgi:hypothetical protein
MHKCSNIKHRSSICNTGFTDLRRHHVQKQDTAEGQKEVISPREAQESKGKNGKAIPVTGRGGP